VSKSFGGIQAVNGVTLTLNEGVIASLIGPNGAGKTTLFNIISGTFHADSGRIHFLNSDVTNATVQGVCRMGIARTFQKFNVFPHLTVFENIYAGTLSANIDTEARTKKVREILKLLGLLEKAEKSVAEISVLDVKLMELGRALATDPRLLLLDEMVGGLTGEETEQVCQFMKSLNEKGYTILQIGHEMGPIMNTSQWIYVLNKGSLIAEGPPEKVRENERVLEVYLRPG
jgi:branched-chain amino acid transport system ATP-binding protein